MRILVTGSEGTLGPWLTRELTANGHEVWGCGRRHSGRKGYVRCDVAEHRQVERAFCESQPDVCYHLAAEFGRLNGQGWYEQLWHTNCVGTRNVIDQCVKHGAHLVLASSSEAYGTLADEHALLTEDLLEHEAPHFHNEYALSKWTNERQVAIAQVNEGLKATVLRFFNVYGPGERYTPYRSVVCQFLHKAMHGQPLTVHNATRDFLYVADWARTVARVATTPAALGEAINIGGDEAVSIMVLAGLVASVTDAEIIATPSGREKANVHNKRPSLEKAKRLLAHEPKVTLMEGLKLTHVWMEATEGHGA